MFINIVIIVLQFVNTIYSYRWGINTEILRQEALKASHPYTCERLMALYEISIGKRATHVGKATKRNPQTFMAWVLCYNEKGSDAVEFQILIKFSNYST
jgi:hypothetical protein